MESGVDAVKRLCGARRMRGCGGRARAMVTGYDTKRMLNRWIGILSAAAMLLANAAIIVQDILPRWFPDDAPPSDAQLLSPGERRQVQVGIYYANGRPVGCSWTRSHRKSVGGLVQVITTTVLGPIRLPGGMTVPRIRVETEITYRANELRVDELEFSMFGLGLPISLRGAAMSTGEFAARWQVASQRGDFILDAGAPAALGDVIRPFDRLPDLHVGQTWHVQLLDPLSHILPQLKASGVELEPILIRVTGQTTVTHRGQPVEVYVVDGGSALAYVTEDGRVLRQEVEVPLLGRLVLLDEPYDEAGLERAKKSVPIDWDTGPLDRESTRGE